MRAPLEASPRDGKFKHAWQEVTQSNFPARLRRDAYVARTSVQNDERCALLNGYASKNMGNVGKSLTLLEGRMGTLPRTTGQTLVSIFWRRLLVYCIVLDG